MARVLRPVDMKDLPEVLPCKCGDIGITLRPRGGKCPHPWTVYCLNPDCDFAVRGFDSQKKAILAGNKEVREK